MEQKRLTLSEYDAIVAFDRLCFPQDHWTEEDWRELLADERAVYLALLDDGRIVGDVFVYNWQGERDYGKIMNLAVHPAYRGRRLAAGLLRAATELLQAAGLPRICGETRLSNEAMRRTFAACGYRLTRSPDQYTVGEILMLTEGSLAPVSCLTPGAAPCHRMADCRTYEMWKGLNDLISNYFGNITLADLALPDQAGNDYVI